MGRELQKKKNRSSINKVTRRKQNIRKRPNITGSKLVADSWDKNQTLAQNYARLGLTHRLKTATGGKEQHPSKAKDPNPAKSNALGHQEARITRGEDGSILKVEYSKNLLYDTLGGGDDNDDDERETPSGLETETDLVRALKHRATLEVKTERLQSDRETDWVQRLVAKHGDDYQAMFWDKELNIRQQSIGDIKRRIKKWQASQKKA
ncbi:Nucleolar protein 16 [Orbilia oligospora]|uniref:Nucleolar protein 16 n=1 Tax=Orbilia oligospora TaxID=2813651 RepID=A0A7C8PQK6_ORBOL|nr:Nucleolar protein 16 [Orbilia oligospora]KAF3194481.1 Nucleolar protein 16 [Orbilia oligospora]KAF3245438.1 Nucleolar protein 16 [Orbilia oligospora]KAF3251869.1 Nucleolar protein 16 [Orbilia oligospora]KAF3275994.1 Nucleolar protein 16 [Orbilia oligospora]